VTANDNHVTFAIVSAVALLFITSEAKTTVVKYTVTAVLPPLSTTHKAPLGENNLNHSQS
jgi:hypothetical protein